MKKKLVMGIIAASVLAGATATTFYVTSKNPNFKVNEKKFTLELGDAPEAHIDEYVSIKEEYKDQVVYDFSKVDAYKEGEYKATASYKNKKEEFKIVVDDTIAPKVDLNEKLVVEAGYPVYASDIIFSITEKSGEVKLSFAENECKDEEVLSAVDENSGLTGVLPTDEQIAALEGDDEVAKEQAEAELQAEDEKNKAEAVDVKYNNVAVLYYEKGDYVNTLTVEDINGNKSEFEVNIVVRTKPEITAADFSANVGEDVNYMNGVTAVDSDGNDITADITIDTSAVDLNTPGTYKVVYTVKDANDMETSKEITLTINAPVVEETTTTTTETGSNKSSGSTGGNSSSNSSGSSNSGSSSGSGSGSGSSGSSSGSSGSSSGSSSSEEEFGWGSTARIPSGYSYDTFCTYNGMYGYFPSNPDDYSFGFSMDEKAWNDGYADGGTYQIQYNGGLLTFYYYNK